MREVKFRAWLTLSDYDDDGNDKDYCGMASRISVHHDGDIGFSVDEGHHTFGGDIFERALDNGTVSEYEEWCLWEGRFELMQYTGLKDKNGVEIYEGDVLRMEQPVFGVTHIMKCEWGTQGFMFNVMATKGNTSGTPEVGDAYSGNVVVDHAEVIGNIYENPELLNGGGDA